MGHPLSYTPSMRHDDARTRSQTMPRPTSARPESIPIDTFRKTQSVPTNPSTDANSASDPVSFDSPESPSQPLEGPDLENGGQAPATTRHWWHRNRSGPRQHSAATAEAHKKSPMKLFKEIIFSSWVNLLLVFIPVGIALHFVNVNPTVVFVMNFLAIIPLAGVPNHFHDRFRHQTLWFVSASLANLML